MEARYAEIQDAATRATNLDSSADEFVRWALALARVESDGEEVPPSDKGRARGVWRMHPPFFDEFRAPAQLGETWLEWDACALWRFWCSAVRDLGLHPVHVGMLFHVGAGAYKSGEWDTEYAARLQTALIWVPGVLTPAGTRG